MIEYVWDLAEMSREEYRALPWAEKRVLLRRHLPTWIAEACFGCGRRLRDVEHEKRVAALPDHLKDSPWGLLLYAHQKEKGLRIALGAVQQKTDGGDFYKL